MKRAILFDLDGTLVDSLDDIADAVETVLSERGFPGHPRDAYRDFIGEGLGVLLERALPPDHRDAQTVRQCVEHARAVYAQHLVDKTQPYPGIVALLDALAERSVVLAVLSNKPDDFTRVVVARTLGTDRFAIVRGALPDVPRKPDPTAAQTIAGELDVPAEQWLFVGDTIIDLQTAQAAGMTPVGVLWGFRPRELRASNAAHVIDDPREVLVALGAGT